MTEHACVAGEIHRKEAPNSTELPIRVLYIVGAGRSGSTLLDTVLGSHPQVIGVGELVNLHVLGWSTGDVCACGQQSLDCEFWNRVRSEWIARVPQATVEGYIALQARFEQVRLFGLSRWLRLFQEKQCGSREFREYQQQTVALFQAIAKISGRRVVVDSSKSPLRAALLTTMPELDVKLLHLVRDARAVAWSRMKSYKADLQAGITREFRPKPAWISVGYWVWINLVTLLLRRGREDSSLELRYEDFVSQPATAMQQLGTWSGLDVSVTSTALLAGEPLRPEHTIAGNRLRMSGQVRLKPDWEWASKLPRWDRAVCWLLAGWLLKRFGYQRCVEQPVIEPTHERVMTNQDIHSQIPAAA